VITVFENTSFGTIDDLGKSKKKKGLKKLVSKVTKGAKGITKLVKGLVGGGKVEAPEEPTVEVDMPRPVAAFTSPWADKPWLLPTLIGGGAVVILMGLLVATGGKKGD